MKKLFALALVVSTAALVNSVFAFAKYVDITTTYAGNDVANFPVLLKITSTTPAGFYADVKNAGADLKFTDASGSGDYPYEIDTWAANGDSYIWVKLPTLSAGMTFRMYYGDEEQTTQTTKPTDVWTGYDLVCHVSGNANDSTINAKHGMLNVNEGARSTTGMIGSAYGVTKSGSGPTMIHPLYPSTIAYKPVENPNFTISCWMRYNVAAAAWESILGPRNGNQGCWGLTGAASNNDQIRVYYEGNNGYKTFVTKGMFPLSVWKKLDVVYTSSTVALYVDGEQIGEPQDSTTPTFSWVYWFGWGAPCGNGDFGSSGTGAADFDECRVMAISATSDRIKADYLTVSDPGTFLRFGDPQGGGPTVQVLPQGVIVK